MRKITRLLLLLVSAALTSCSTISDHIPGVYRLDIQQGNIIDQEMIDDLRPNMTKRQVLYILGSPMLIDVFHQKRWDYIYSKQPGREVRQQQRISLFFENDILASVQGDFRPSTKPVTKEKTDTTVDVPKRKEKKTVFGEIVKFFSFDDDEISSNEEKNTSEETKTEQQTESTPEEREEKSLPDADQEIKTETPDTNLENNPENPIEQISSDKNTPESIDSESESIQPEQNANDEKETVIEQIEDKAIEDDKKQEELSKPPVL